MEDMYHIPVNSVLSPAKTESIDFMNVVPPSFSVVTAPMNTGSSTVVCSNGTNVVALFAGTATGSISPDGINWTPITLPVSGTWSAVAWGNSLFMATDSASNTIITSPDGVTWTTHATPLSNGLTVAFGNGYFVITQSSSAAMCKTANGTSFTNGTLPTAASYAYVAYASTSALWMAVVSGSTASATSPDGVTWTALAMTTAGNWSCIASNGTGFVVLTNDATGLVNSSANGTSWVSETWDTDYYRGIAWGNSLYMGAASSSGDIQTSADGTTNVYVTPIAGKSACAICFHSPSNTWVVVQTSLSAVYVSTNGGSTWTTASFATPFSCGAYGNGTYVALCSSGAVGFVSPTGFTWRSIPLPLSGIQWSSVVWGGDKFVAFPYAGNQGMYSYNGIEWYVLTFPVSMTKGCAAAFGNNQWNTAGGAASTGMYSSDGIRWQLASQIASGTFASVAYGDNKFVQVFSGTSNMGMTATPGSGLARLGAMSLSTTWSDVAYGRNVFLAVNATFAASVSVDGLTWRASTMPNTQLWNSVVFAFGNFLVTASNGNTMLVTPDGWNWRAVTLPVTAVLACAVVGKNNVILLGSDGTILASNDINGAHYGNIA